MPQQSLEFDVPPSLVNSQTARIFSPSPFSESPDPPKGPTASRSFTASLAVLKKSAHSKSRTAISKGKAKRTIKYWPADFYVSEIVNGLHQLKAMKDTNKRSNLVINFYAVFHLKYHKTTYAKYKGLMETDDEILQDIIEDFVSRGEVEDALWPVFVETIKDRVAILEAGKNSGRPGHGQKDADILFAEAKSFSDSEPSDSALRCYSDSDSDLDLDLDSGHPNAIRCAYCNEKLPSSPTQQLIDMGLSLEKISVLDPLPGNPNHCKISSFTKHQDYCAQHRLEVDELPLARLQ